MHALVIEDNVIITSMIANQLRECGFDTIDCAETCAEAISSAAIQCPDLITADHRLQGESGIAAVRQICENRVIPVIYIVALPDEVRAEEPVAVILQKPFSSRELTETVREVMNGARS